MRFFKSYDIRGIVPTELDEQMAYSIGLAYQAEFRGKKVCVGHDIRLSSPSLSDALASGLQDGGAEVFELGQCGTEEVYFATFHYELDGGIMVTASHNPENYNGMKLVREQARPVSGDSGLFAIRDRIVQSNLPKGSARGGRQRLDARPEYVKHLLGYVDNGNLKPLKVLANPGNGCAGPVIDALSEHLPFQFSCIQHEPDGTFPNGIPNPLLPENRSATSQAVVSAGADVGLAWDGDFDRCFLFDEKGRFIEGYYIVGLLAQSMLDKHPGSRVIHDPRLTWNTIDIVNEKGGTPIETKTGHAFIKERMRAEDAVYGGEMSAHHYFREFAYCDSGMISWLLILDLMSRTGQTLSSMVDGMMEAYPVSGEINRRIADAKQAIEEVSSTYAREAESVSHVDGVSMDMGQWRFNLRCSNTEPLVRLNVEARGNRELMEEKTAEILSLLDNHGNA